MAKASIIAKLERKREGIKHKLTSFNDFVGTLLNITPETESFAQLLIQLESRIARYEPVLDEFEINQNEIEAVVDENQLKLQYQERDEFSNNYFRVMSEARIILNKNKRPIGDADITADQGCTNNVNISHNNNTNLSQNIKLPTIKLPTFDGSLDRWLEFKDTFQSLIHNNLTITEIQKFHYLRAALEGAAGETIQSIDFSEKNYGLAWEVLCKRFDNHKLLVHNHVKSIFELQVIPKESATHIRVLIDSVNTHLRSLKILEQPTNSWDTLIIYILASKLDKNTAREWEEFKIKEKLPCLKDMIEFLISRAELLETLEARYDNKIKVADKSQLNYTKGSKPQYRNASMIARNSISCYVCKKNHYINLCETFKNLTIPDRLEKIRDLRLCTNCLNPGHTNSQCFKGGCKKCNKRHNTLLHLECNNTNQPNVATKQVSTIASNSIQANNEILLATAYVNVTGSNGNSLRCKALLDSGSQSSFISQELSQRLGTKITPSNISISGFNGLVSHINKQCNIQINSCISNYSKIISCYVVPIITDELPINKVEYAHWNIPENMRLADPDFHKPSKIDLLLGANVFWELILKNTKKLGQHVPTMCNTRLGWIISGPVNNKCVSPTRLNCNLIKLDIQNQLQRFWEIETDPIERIKSIEENDCEQQFQNTTTRNSDGKFIVTIPLKESPNLLGDSVDNAKKRFLSLERKFEKNDEFKHRYVDFINEYIALGHMQTATTANKNKEVAYFLPHHGVLKEDSLTTKLRVVFDGSCRTTTGYSLNDIQLVGPTIQQELFSILLRFRQHRYVVSADVAKMYRQVLVSEEQYSLQQIFWRDDPNKDLDIYQLRTVTYGTASAPFLAIRCLFQLALDSENEYPIASQIIKRDFYVDDLLTGADDKETLILLCRQIAQILKSGCFELRKWVANDSDILNSVDTAHQNTNISLLGLNEKTKTLGLQWSCREDMLTYSIGNQAIISKSITKRIILSDIAQIYDPLGLLGPCIILAKIILQNLWVLKLSWDDSVPKHIRSKWVKFKTELSALNAVKIPRHVMYPNATNVEIHGFCDASVTAYGACVYVRSHDASKNIKVALLCSKTKVAPLNCISIPRLELCGALILSKLIDKVRRSMELDLKTYYWCDSQVVLCWLRTQPNLLQQFVGNRVAQIQTLSNVGSWHYIGTKENPADMLSRGLYPNHTLTCRLWWQGPSWLANTKDTWPIQNSLLVENDLPEIRKRRQEKTFICNMSKFTLFETYSVFTKLKRVTAYCLRFIHNAKSSPNNRIAGSLSVNELNTAVLKLTIIAQLESFRTEIKTLAAGNPIDKTSKILSLSPFLDENGLLRVGGRLRNSNFDFNKRHPLLLDGKHPFTNLIAVHEHKKLLHAGPQLTLASLRETFWPTNGKNVIKKVINDCVQCFKVKPRSIYPKMGDLPKHRTELVYPFFATGIDYAGPILIKEKKGRSSKLIKCYICVFICFATKAIHIEPLTDLTAEAFVAMLRRFVARRGKPRHIYSDNGTYFVKANSDLKQLGQYLNEETHNIIDICANDSIEWHFTPPQSPHFGGLWEAAVKSCKYHIKRVLGESKLIFEDLLTFLVQIEGILNSRPLCQLSNDPNDYEPITPSHFLIGRSLNEVPDPNVLNIRTNRLSRFQQLQMMRQHFWKRWSREYITTLQQRSKWKSSQGTITEGTLVLLRDDNLPPSRWKLGRVCEVHRGKDSEIRVVSVKTQNGVLRRAVTKICPLPSAEVDNP